MSGCADWRERILEADLEELHGAGSSTLAAHLDACGGCRALADAVVRTSAELARSFAAAAASDPDVAADAVIARLRRTAPATAGTVVTAAGPPSAAPWLPFAAAALIAGLLALPAEERPARLTPPPPPAMPPAVEVPEGRNVVVLPTADPQITVLWFF